MRKLSDIEKEYHSFNDLRSEYQQWMEGETSEIQRVTSARIDATYSLRNWVESQAEKSQKECYKSYLRLVDGWFSYEALLMLADEQGYAAGSSPKTDTLLKSRITNTLVSDIVQGFHDALVPVIEKDNRKRSLEQYIDTLSSYPKTSKTQLQHLSALKDEVVSGTLKNDNYSRILAFVYAIRNAYAHNGETARSGTKHYQSKLIILTAGYEFMVKFILRTASALYEELVADIS